MVVPAAMQARTFAARYSELPSWATLVQLFLALGWGRAAIAHGLSPGWWSGAEVLRFLEERDGHAVFPYGLWLDNVVGAMPAFTAVIVLGLQLLVATLLVLNARPVLGLAIGMWLNTHFLLAGQVNPSIFYMVSAMALLAWRIDRDGRRPISRTATRWTTITAAAVTVAVLPSVRTMAPERAIEDPALVLITLSMLVVVTLWVANGGRPAPVGEVVPDRRSSRERRTPAAAVRSVSG